MVRHRKHFSNQILTRRRNDVNFNYTLVVTTCLLIFLNKKFHNNNNMGQKENFRLKSKHQIKINIALIQS